MPRVFTLLTQRLTLRLRLAVARAGFELPAMCSPDELLQNEDEDD